MNKLFNVFTILVLLSGLATAQTGVFFSEYIEGSSNNKAIEIYNGSGSELDLTNYRVIRANNGAITLSDSLTLSGTLSVGDVFVIANSSAVSDILDVSDITSTLTYYNGDDFMGLQFDSAGTWMTIDAIGVLGEDPGSSWPVAGVANATGEHTLVRKTSITTGNSDWASSADSTTEDSEWVVYDQDTFNYLGQHPGGTFPVVLPKIFFSEYIEGGSNNKAIEIYNGEDAEYDLTQLNILTNYNGNTWSGMHSFPIGTTLAAGEVWVMANEGLDSLTLLLADEVLAYDSSGYLVGFNGDDVRALVQIDGTDTTVIDIIGAYDGVDPGSGWSVAGVDAATANHTLVRKESVTAGNSDWAASAGTTIEDSEWVVYDQDTFDYLGIHPGSNLPPATEPIVAAPTPTVDSANVISLFSNAYTNVVVDTWSTDWDSADLTDTTVAGNDTKLYTNLVFAGIETTSQTIDASEMTHFHMDIWTPDVTAEPAVFKIKLVDFGANGGWDGGPDDVEHEITLSAATTPALATGEWVSIDLPLSDFTGLVTTEHMAQYIISGNPNTVYVDNMYFYKEPLPGEMPKVFFSEYIEGGSNRKSLEIYNPGDEAVDLTKFVIRQSSNGGGWEFIHAFPEGATLASKDVWIIMTDDDFSGYFDSANADEVVGWPSVVHYNGNDARALAYVSGTDTTIVDVIGIPDSDLLWDVAGVTGATLDHTLVRKESVTMGNTDWAASAGTTTEDSEWVVYDVDTFIYLGQHPGVAATEKPNITSVNRNVMVPAADQSTDVIAEVLAENELASVSLVYSTDGEIFTSIPMASPNDTLWTGSIPSSVYNDGDLFGFFVAAEDNIGQTDTSDISMILAGTSPIERIKDQVLEDGSLEFDGLVARVTGTVSAGTGTYSTGRIEAYMQDTTAGILVIAFGTVDPPMVENNSYTVAGEIIQYNGLVEIEPFDPSVDIIDNGSVTPLVPMEVSIGDINANPEYYESRLVQVNNVELSSETPWLGGGSSSGSNMDVLKGTDTLTFRVDADTDIWGAASPEFPQDIVGVLGQYNDYQLLPRRLTDFLTPVSVDNETGIPTVYALNQNYPNPFNPSTKINFSLPENGLVTLQIYDILGRVVETLVNEELSASYHTVEFDASQLSSGIHFYRLQVNDFVSVKKMMLMK